MRRTRLLIACRGPAAARLPLHLPPQLDAGSTSLAWRRASGDRSVTELDLPAGCLSGVRQIVPCLSTAAGAGYRFTLEYRTAAGGEEGAAALDAVGEMPMADESPVPTAAEAVGTEIDLFAVRRPLAAGHLRVEVAGDVDPTDDHLLSVSLRRAMEAPGAPPAAGASAGWAADIPVPARSQMRLDAGLANRVCSPTCLSMLLSHYERGEDVHRVIEAVHHRPRDMYGVWPANVQAASRWGMRGYLAHFPDWEAARWLLQRGVPLIASVRYEPGELAGSPIRRTSGHLILLRGYEERADGVRVRVNDPAAPKDEAVARDYDLSELLEVWLGRSAIAYVLFPTD